jgi:hypothetical protein
MIEPGQPRRRSQQHQKKRAIGLILGGGAAAFRSLHDDMAVGRAQAPPARAAAFSEADIKKRKSVRHRYSLSPLLHEGSTTVNEKRFETANGPTSFLLSELGFCNECE